ncbi:MAG: hypothetical protein K8S21_10000 [Gemmatimonadetes bacterium]|nr:hypothetical protein [Gemmatimonadota bacterium]
MKWPSATALVAVTAITIPLGAQRPAAPGTSGGIGPRGAPAQGSLPSFTMPTVARVRELANVADLLVEKHRKLGLDDAATDSLKRIAVTINERNAPHLAVYDSMRTRMRTAMAAGGGPGGPGAGGPGGGPGAGGPGAGEAGSPGGTRGERASPMRDAMRTLQTAREADIPVVLALVPADKQEEAKKLIAEQQEDLEKSLSPRGPGGAGGAGGRPRP